MRAGQLRGQLLRGVGDGRASVVGQLRADDYGASCSPSGRKMRTRHLPPLGVGWM